MDFFFELTPIRLCVLILFGILVYHSVYVYHRSIRSRYPNQRYPVDVSPMRREDYWERYIGFNLSHPGNFLTYRSNHTFPSYGNPVRSIVAWVYQHQRWRLSMSFPSAETCLPLLRALQTCHPFQSLDVVDIVLLENPLMTEDPEAFLCAHLIAVISEILEILIQSPRLRQVNITWRLFHCRTIFYAYPLHLHPPEEPRDEEENQAPDDELPGPPNEWHGAVISFSQLSSLYGMTVERFAPELGEAIRMMLHIDRVQWVHDENYAVRKTFFTR